MFYFSVINKTQNNVFKQANFEKEETRRNHDMTNTE